jgi:muramoyltetrapeptide carboxypeptidase LdcA involved in peptidoglycan recycling
MFIPEKCKPGDHIRVVSPSKSLSILSEETIEIATQRLENLGFAVSISRNVSLLDEFGSSSIEARIQDLHDAFADENVNAIITTIGGYNSNQLLSYLDFELIKQNPKIFVGYSDITALSHAIYANSAWLLIQVHLSPHLV